MSDGKDRKRREGIEPEEGRPADKADKADKARREREKERPKSAREREKSAEDSADDTAEDEDAAPLEDEFDFEAGFDEEVWKDIPHEEASKLLRGLEGLIPDILKRSVLSGLSNLILSEDGIRSIVADKNLPKEAAGFVLNQADATRREILRIVSREIRIFLEDMDFGGEIAKILTSLSFEVRTEIRFIPNDERVKPNIRNRVTVKRARDGKPVETEDKDRGPVSTDEPAADEPAAGEAAAGEVGGREESGRRRWTRRKRRDEPEPDGE